MTKSRALNVWHGICTCGDLEVWHTNDAGRKGPCNKARTVAAKTTPCPCSRFKCGCVLCEVGA